MDPNIKKLMAMADESVQELVDLHRTLVRIPTVNTGSPDSGNELAVCEILQQRLDEAGVQNQTFISHPGRGNLVASIGSSNKHRLLLMSHTDVVPEGEQGWTFPPFGAVIDGGKIYGRGSEDAKSLVSSGLLSLIILKRSGIALEGEVRFLAAADEEAGGEFGAAWMAEHYPDEIRATWALNEGGGTPVERDGQLGFLLASGEKGRLEAEFQIKGKSGHAANPWAAENALLTMGILLEKINKYDPKIDTSHPIFQYLPWFSLNEWSTPDNLDQIVNEEMTDIAMANLLKAVSRMSIVPTLASAGVKSNSIPGQASLTCDIRTLPSQDVKHVLTEISKLLEDLPRVECKLKVTAVSNSSPVDTVFTRALSRAVGFLLDREQVELIPFLTVGFTDSRFIRPLGAEVYGFAPLPLGCELLKRGMHGVDEFIEIDALVLRMKLNILLSYLMLGGASSQHLP